VDSVAKKGVQVPLLITPEGVIISGHRRRQAAVIARLKEVPVIVRNDLTDPLDIEWVLIETNRQREKTAEVLAREAQKLFAIEEERAKKRQSATQAKPGDGKVGR